MALFVVTSSNIDYNSLEEFLFKSSTTQVKSSNTKIKVGSFYFNENDLI